MKLQVLQENLSQALNITSRFASTRAQLPVLANVLLSTKKNKLIVSATNLEISVSLAIGAKVRKEGEITVPARLMADLVSNLQVGAINLEAEKEKLKISSQNFSSDISGMNSSDFPAVPQSIGKGVLNLPKEDFLQGLSQVLFAASIDETRPVLTGVLFIFPPAGKQGNKNNFVLVATDGFRLSQKKMSLKPLKGQKEQRLILPKSALSELARLSGDEEEVRFAFREGDSQVVFSVDNAVLSSRVIEGEFPDFERIIPKEIDYKINLDKEELLRAVKLASVFARDSANVVKLSVKKDSIELSAESSQSGSQETQVDAKVENNSGKGDKEFEIAFNYRFLEDFLQVVEGDEVQLDFSNPNSPGIFTDPEDPNFLHLIMPVRTQG